LKKLEDILLKESDLTIFKNFIGKIMYLNHLEHKDNHEKLFYEVYEPIIQLAVTSFRKFDKFTAENHDTF
jgi:Na+-transporting NADH:ubiquinone oxidoreductase subunit NqrF